MSQVPLRPRGRPSRLYSDLAMLQAMERSGNHGNMMLQQPLTPHTPDTPQAMDHSADESNSNQNMPPPPESQTTEEPEAPPPVEANGQPDGTILAGNDLPTEHDESLSWSVEIAAVNQAILSLTGQQPISTSIKPEGTKVEQCQSQGQQEDQENVPTAS